MHPGIVTSEEARSLVLSLRCTKPENEANLRRPKTKNSVQVCPGRTFLSSTAGDMSSRVRVQSIYNGPKWVGCG